MRGSLPVPCFFHTRLTSQNTPVLPDSAQKKEIEGEVVAVGPGALAKDGTRVQMVLKAGDRVLLPEYGGHELELGSEVG